MALRIGDVVGGCYRLERKLGEGGMGAVYVGFDEGLERQVALKVLGEKLTGSDDGIKRFRREALISSRVRHPNIIEIYGANVQDGTPWIAMELLHGRTLREHMEERGTLSPEETCWLAEEVLAPLEVVHGAGLVHRDLKPENLFIEQIPSGGVRLKILDFGIARATGPELTHLTKTGGTIGTPWYLSPEQGRGARELDGRSDLYSLGAIAYECLCGRRSLEAEGYNELLFKLFSEPPRPLREARPSVPEPLARVVDRVLRKPPEERFADARAMRQAIADTDVERIPIGGETRTLGRSVPGLLSSQPSAREPSGRQVAPTLPLASEAGAPSPARSVPSSDARPAAVVEPTVPLVAAARPGSGTVRLPDGLARPVPPARKMDGTTPMTAEPLERPRRSVGLFVRIGWAAIAAIPIVAAVVAMSAGDSEDEEPTGVSDSDAPSAASTEVPSTPETTFVIAPVAFTSAFAGELVVDGQAHGSVSAGTALTLHLPLGSHGALVRATAPRLEGVVWGERSFELGASPPIAVAFDDPCSEGLAFVPGPPASFCMDRTEVTVAAFVAAVRAGHADPPADAGGIGCNWSEAASRADHPMSCVSFEEAAAFCRGAGGRLPTEAEWTRAASGTGAAAYPWGEDAPDASRLRWSGGGEHGSAGGTAPVGSHAAGASPFGVLDLAGSVFEWNEGSGERRAIRGGSWADADPTRVRVDARTRVPMRTRSPGLGLRCVRAPGEPLRAGLEDEESRGTGVRHDSNPMGSESPAGAEATPASRARACLARGDGACAVRALRGRAQTERELALLIESYTQAGDMDNALREMQEYLRRYPSGGRASEFRRLLTRSGR